MTKKTVTNTADQDPLLTLLDRMSSGGPSRAIERMEARGQAELVNADVLPTEGLISDRAAWEAMGITIGELVNGDPLFTHVTLPAGWSKRRTDHAMWSDLVDSKGRKRAGIGYKAAPYDRWATIHPVRRFDIARDYNNRDALVMQVKDMDAVVFSTEPVVMPAASSTSRQAREDIEQAARLKCCQWLADHGYPDFANPAAYWD